MMMCNVREDLYHIVGDRHMQMQAGTKWTYSSCQLTCFEHPKTWASRPEPPLQTYDVTVADL